MIIMSKVLVREGELQEANHGSKLREFLDTGEQIGEYERLNRLLERSERVAAVLEAGSSIKQEIMEVDD